MHAQRSFDFTRAAGIQSRFDDFDRAHPEVFRLFRFFAHMLKQKGKERFSADAILHRIRWEFAVNMECDGGFKVNNDFSSRYARKLISEDPAFDGFFELRRLKAQ